MMGEHQEQKNLFSYAVDLDKRIRNDHPLRLIKERVDFDWVREEVRELYGKNGNVSVDPVIIVKLLFLLYYDNIRSERELMKIIPERLDYLWFLGLNLDDEIADHSVLSKARSRWGKRLFEKLFVRTIELCMQAGLVRAETIHVDGSLVVADAARDSFLKADKQWINCLKSEFEVQEKKLSKPLGNKHYQSKNQELINLTDPDAPCVSRNKPGAKGEPRAYYKVHRVVDNQCGVITATETTPGDVEENRKLEALIEQHERNTTSELNTVVADKQYGTVDNFRKLQSRGIETHMGILHEHTRKDHQEIFGKSRFQYDRQEDVYRCPAGQKLYHRRYDPKRQASEYHTRKGTCEQCPAKEQCTRAKTGRTIMRHLGQELIDQGHAQSKSKQGRRNMIRRKWLVEGSFGQATRHHFKRSRYRRLWRQQIQDWLIASVQNIKKYIQTEYRQYPVAHTACVLTPISRENRMFRKLVAQFGTQDTSTVFWS
ncbi:MAG: transposase [Opitutales bacterium]|nr:transposase [Opitutales bacterium]